MTNDDSLIYFVSNGKKIAVSFLLPVPFQEKISIATAFISDQASILWENKATSNVQPLISDLNAYNISTLINRKI